MNYQKILIIAILTILSSSIAKAQDSAYARSIISRLSSSEMYGRGSSYSGERKAADLVIRPEMKRLGLKPLGKDYYQTYFQEMGSFNGPCRLKIGSRELIPYSDFRIVTHVPDTAQLVKIVDGIKVFSVEKLETYSPIVFRGNRREAMVAVRKDALPKNTKRIKLDIPFVFNSKYESVNVCGYVEGEVDTMVVFTAHYDHCGTMGDDVVFPGAHDNASGTAAVLDLARMAVLKKPHYTMVFMLFSGEESGLCGSRFAAEQQLIDYSKVKLLCNIDMFCGGDGGLMFFNAKSDDTQWAFDRMVELNKDNRYAKEIRPRENRPNSDHYPFSKICPAIFLLSMGGPAGDYHTPTDRCESCGLEHYNDYMTLIMSLAGML